MRIIVNTRLLFVDHLDGIGRLTFEVLRRVIKRRSEDLFFLIYDRNHDHYFDFGPNATNVVMGPPARHPILWKIWFDYRIPNLVKKLKGDCFLSMDGFNSLGIEIPSIIFGHDIAPYHYPEHMKWSHRWYCRYYFKRFFEKSDFIIANSNFTKKDISETLKIKASKILVAHSGRNVRFKPLSTSQKIAIRNQLTHGNPYFIFTGTLSPRKNVVGLIEAFNIFKQRYQEDHHLVIVGREGWKYRSINTAIKNSSFEKSIHKLVDVDDKKITELVGGAQAVIYVSLYEGFGLPIIEGMAANVPIICSNTSSMPEVAGGAALLVDPQNVTEIAEAMHRISSNLDVRNTLIAKGVIQHKKFNWNDQSETLDALLDQIQQRA